MNSELSGKTAVVTGASSGIGRAIAIEFAAAGADVLVHARNSQQDADETAQQITAEGRQARVELCDLQDEAQQDHLADVAWAWQGKIDIWVNNAGADVLTGGAAQWPFERKLEALWRVDVVGTIRLTRRIGRLMQQSGGGSIINIGWDQAAQGMAGDSGEAFSSTKAAIMAFSKSAALSLAPQVRVNCIAPGWIKTGWGEQASEAWQKRAMRESQLGRWGSPQDIAQAALFLASARSSFIDAQVIPVNGGYRPR